jgi:hypothetical protein
MINYGTGVAFVLLPPATNVNVGTWDGLARAAESFANNNDLKFEFKEDGEVLVYGLRAKS